MIPLQRPLFSPPTVASQPVHPAAVQYYKVIFLPHLFPADEFQLTAGIFAT